MKDSVNIKEVRIYPFVSIDEFLDNITNEKKILVALNAEKIIHMNDEILEIVNNNIGYADGVGIVFGMKRLGIKEAIKIPGCELWLKIIERYYSTKSFYLVGGRPGTINNTVQKLKTEYPGINILNYRDGYFNDAEKKELLADIQAKEPEIVFVAMGSPKQEFLMKEMLALHPALYQGLGGSFDVYVENVKRAPKWWRDHNLEWAYRLIKQPFRLFRQLHLIKYLILLLFLKKGRIKYSV